jgi:transposase
VYRRPEERFAQCCFSETVAYGGGSVMMWAGISMQARTELVFIPGGGRGGGLNADRYITDILQDHVVPYAGFFDEGFHLMQDNAPCHTAGVTKAYLAAVGIPTLTWPPLSPDLNPIEHMWDYLKRKVRARDPAPETILALQAALVEEWDVCPQDTIRKLIRSMRNRIECVRNANGGNTRY